MKKKYQPNYKVYAPRDRFLGRVLIFAWSILFLHYILHTKLGFHFDVIADAIAPHFPHIPLFNEIESYYSSDYGRLESDRWTAYSFYIVNYTIYFTVFSILAGWAVLHAFLFCRNPETIEFVPTAAHPTLKEATLPTIRDAIGVLLLFIGIFTGIFFKMLNPSPSTFAEHSILGRGFLVFLESVSLLIFVALPPTCAVIFHFSVTCQKRKNPHD